MLCVNNEYTHEEILFPDGQVGCRLHDRQDAQVAGRAWRLDRRGASQRRQVDGGNQSLDVWPPHHRRIRRSSSRGRGRPRVDADEGVHASPTPARSRPATSRDGRSGHGTVNNCAHGITPWGTFLTCEENLNGNFGATGALSTRPTATETGKLNRRYGVTRRRASAIAGTRPIRAGTSPPTRTRQTTSAGSSRSTRTTRKAQAGQAHGARPLQARERAVRGRQGQSRRVLHGRRRAQRVRLQVRLQASAQHNEQQRQQRNLLDDGTLVRGAVQRQPDRPVDRAGAGHDRRGRRGAARQPELRRRRRRRGAGQDPDQDAHGRRRGRRDDDGPPRVDRRASAHRRLRRGRGLLHADQQQSSWQPATPISNAAGRLHRAPARPARRSTPPTRAKTTSTATSSAGARLASR